MAIEGVIAERTRAVLPVTFDALEQDERFGDDRLLALIEGVEEELFGVIPTEPQLEAYPLVVINFVAKLVAIELINPGIDFWMSQSLSVVTRGPDETDTYVDRAAKLKELRTDLLKQTREKWGEISAILGITPKSSNAPRMKINTLADELLTPSPQEFPRPYAVTNRS